MKENTKHHCVIQAHDSSASDKQLHGHRPFHNNTQKCVPIPFSCILKFSGMSQSDHTFS